jgi:hypothetical protein
MPSFVEMNVGWWKRLWLYATQGVMTIALASTPVSTRRPRLGRLHAIGTTSSGMSRMSSARASAPRPQSAPSAATRVGVGSFRDDTASNIAPTTTNAVIVSDITSPSFTQMFGEIAAMPAATRPTPSPPMRRPSNPMSSRSTVPSTTIA